MPQQRLILIIALLSTFVGCEANVPPSQDATDVFPTVWDVVEMDGTPIGYQSLSQKAATSSGNRSHDSQSTSRLSVRRFGETTQEDMQLASRETQDGQVVRIESRISSGKQLTQTVGRRVGSQLEMETTGAGESQRWLVSLPPMCGGYFAVEWSLHKRPLMPGETRRLNAVLPILNQVGEITMTASGTWDKGGADAVETTVLKVQQQITLPDGNSIPSSLWMSESGEIVRTEISALRQVTYRTDEKTAMSVSGSPDFDLGSYSTVSVVRPIDEPHTTQNVEYVVHLANGDPASIFPQTNGQTVKPIDANSAKLSVRSLRPAPTPTGLSSPQPNDDTLAAALAATALIQSDDMRVRSLADRIQPSSHAPWDVAVAVEKFVFETVTEKNFSTALASAAQVARDPQGDCTEHAILMAAICRARGVPCRVLIGLVYVPSLQGFAFHMWNEVWTGAEWIPLDATLGRGGTGGAHIVLRRTDLATQSGYNAFLPVLQVIGQLEIEVTKVDN